jgi:hypothetical protein
MNNEKINTIIAEFCQAEIDDGKVYIVIDGDICGFGLFTDDLNAMHESEKLLDLQPCGEYARRLREIVEMKTNLPWVDDGSFAHIHATAGQRAEALLRTIGKWEES